MEPITAMMPMGTYSVMGSTTLASYTDRADGMRKTMTTSSGTITFHYDENKNVTHETDESGQVVASYTFSGNQPVSMTRSGQTYYYQLNYRGDVVRLTDTNGATVTTYEYDAYGNLISETGSVKNPYRYAGYRYDQGTGLYYLQSRYYNPKMGRFLTRDTFIGEESNPISFNKYSYALNNPVKYTDSSGYAAPAVILALLGVSFGETAITFFVTVSLDPRKWNWYKGRNSFLT